MKSTLQNILSVETVTILPGIYDALSAKLAEQAGFEAAVITGYSLAATVLGKPDIGLLTYSELVVAAKNICAAVKIPIIVDGDTGYGGPLNVLRLVQDLIQLGAAGVILEDQVWPKRCGHMQGKEIVSTAEHLARIRAAVAVKSASGDPFIIIARTDARAIEGLQQAIDRAAAYADAGADMVFVEAPQSIEEIEMISKQLKVPLLINMIEGGKTPLLPLHRLQELRYAAVAYPLTGIYSTAIALANAYSGLRATGMSVSGDHLMNFQQFNDIIGLQEHLELSAKFKV